MHRGTAVGVGREPVLGAVVEAVHPEVGGHAVGQLVPLAVAVGAVRQDVDESGRHHQAGRVDGPGRLQGGRVRIDRDGRHSRAADADAGHGIETRSGVDHTAPDNGHVEGLVRSSCRRLVQHRDLRRFRRLLWFSDDRHRCRGGRRLRPGCLRGGLLLRFGGSAGAQPAEHGNVGGPEPQCQQQAPASYGSAARSRPSHDGPA